MLVTIPLGARLLHVVYEEPAYYGESFLRIFEVWKGGFVYFGGLLLTAIFFIFYFLKPRAESFWDSADFFTPIFCLGTGVGRIACYLQGCCYGKPLFAPWAVQGLHATQLYLFFWEMILFIVLLRLEKLKWQSGHLFVFWIGLSSAGRFVVEFYRDDFRGSMISGLSISQLISFTLLTLSFVMAIYIKLKFPKKI